jgi:hypothetical protein
MWFAPPQGSCGRPCGSARAGSDTKAHEATRSRTLRRSHEARGNYGHQYGGCCRDKENKEKGSAGKDTAGALSNLSWEAIFARDYQKAYDAATRSIKLDPSNLARVINQAYALMFLGRIDEATDIYIGHIGDKLHDKQWGRCSSGGLRPIYRLSWTHRSSTHRNHRSSHWNNSPITRTKCCPIICGTRKIYRSVAVDALLFDSISVS